MLNITSIRYLLNILQYDSSISLKAAMLPTTTPKAKATTKATTAKASTTSTTKAITTLQNKLSQNKTEKISASKPVILILCFDFLL